MIDVVFKWNGAAALEVVKQKASANAERAAVFLHGEIIRALSVPAPPASRPGEPPHRRTGGLVRSVLLYKNYATLNWRVGLASRVAGQGRALEFGTKRMAARPFLSATLAKSLERMKVLAAGKG